MLLEGFFPLPTYFEAYHHIHSESNRIPQPSFIVNHKPCWVKQNPLLWSTTTVILRSTTCIICGLPYIYFQFYHTSILYWMSPKFLVNHSPNLVVNNTLILWPTTHIIICLQHILWGVQQIQHTHSESNRTKFFGSTTTT